MPPNKRIGYFAGVRAMLQFRELISIHYKAFILYANAILVICTQPIIVFIHRLDFYKRFDFAAFIWMESEYQG